MSPRSRAWTIGWVLGTAVVAVAGGLLAANIVVGRRIVRQAGDITDALDGARESTDALFALTDTAGSLERVTRGLRAVREEREAV